MGDASLTDLARAVLHLDRAPERALELDCGEGEGVLLLAREFPSARVRGVDASAEAVRAAVSRVGLNPEGRVAFKRRGARSLPFPDEFFDLVVQNRRFRRREIGRVVRPGGYLIVLSTQPPGRGYEQVADEHGFWVGRRRE